MLRVIWNKVGVIVCAILVLLVLCTSALLIDWVASSKSIFLPVFHHHNLLVTFTGRLEIPSIHVDSVIESVGLTSEGAMDVPASPQKVGFFSLGPQLGEEGTVVLAGHYGWKEGKAAVFDNLSSMQVGDTFSVINAAGSRISFRVRKTALYDKDAIAPEVFVSESGSHLNLIACVGDWEVDEKTYSKREVVFGDRILVQ